jgi:hypothetical protein
VARRLLLGPVEVLIMLKSIVFAGALLLSGAASLPAQSVRIDAVVRIPRPRVVVVRPAPIIVVARPVYPLRVHRVVRPYHRVHRIHPHRHRGHSPGLRPVGHW